ncbi:MAG TPA: hypothetical protein VKZ53_11285 [Candidatus Angelobacter sp.]|nr:hypothetical protein [Candidatus Angelobacter sp.]
MLHITNGESVIHGFREASLPGAYLSWADVLHDGPVPYTATLTQLSDVRAEALSRFGWGTYEEIRAAFAARDRALADFHTHEEVVLWFEHDLFDQLQLIQVLDWLSAQEFGNVRLSLIQIDSFPGIRPFYSLGQLTGVQLAELFPARKTVTAAQMLIARDAWRAFSAPNPESLLVLTHHGLSELPFLGAALMRFFQEYPAVRDGLSRTQRQILRAVESGARRKRDIYFGSRQFEDCPWGDASIYWRIDALAFAPRPALSKISDDEFQLTESGQRLLAGDADWVALSGGIDVWLGGVHLSGAEPAWRWDNDQRTLRRR